MEPMTIAALMAMVAGAGMQYKASTDAQKRTREETMRSLQRQQEYQRQAEAKAMGEAQKYNTDDRAAEQAGIEQQMVQEYMAPVQSAQAINAATTSTQGAVSDDYTAAKARSSVEQASSAHKLARLLAKTGSSNQLRRNEAIRMSDTAAGVGRLGNFAQGMAGADQIGIKAAGTPNAGLMLGGQLLMGAGSVGLASGAGSAGQVAGGGSGVAATPSVASANMSNASNLSMPLAGSTSGGVGMTGAGTVGLRMPAKFQW